MESIWHGRWIWSELPAPKLVREEQQSFPPLPVLLIIRKTLRTEVLAGRAVGRHSDLRSQQQSCALSSVEEHGHRCSAVDVSNWCHTKCCFLGWCRIGHNKRTGKKERAGGVMGRPRNPQPLRESTGRFPTSNAISVWGDVFTWGNRGWDFRRMN